jgi:hypothetical protein
VISAYVTGAVPEGDGRTGLESSSRCQAFVTNPAGSAIVNATGPIRQIIKALVAKGPFSFASLPFKWNMTIGSLVIAQAPEVGYVVA